MAEFCLDCWNQLHKSHKKSSEVTLTKTLYFCEGCEELKPVVILPYRRSIQRWDMILFIILGKLVRGLWYLLQIAGQLCQTKFSRKTDNSLDKREK